MITSKYLTRVVVGIAAATALTSPFGVGEGTAQAATTCHGVAGDTDFDGRAGGADTAIGVPGAHLGSLAGAGAVEIRFGCGSASRVQRLQLATGHRADRFGASLAVGQVNLDSDTYDDLAVGVPGLEVDGHAGAGGVAIFVGSPSGLHLDRVITQATPGVPGNPQTGAHFGAAVAFSWNPYSGELDHIRIGEPGKNVLGKRGAGGYVDLTFEDGEFTQSTETTLDSLGIPGGPGRGDALGTSLSTDFAVGAPGRRVGGHAGAGAVLDTWPGRAPKLVTQDTPGMPGKAEKGDHFGAAVSWQWAGAPGESVGRQAGAGAVERWDPDDPHGRILLTQDSPGIPGASEAGDHFGASVTQLGVFVDDTDLSPRRLVVGAPGEDLGRVADAGTVTWVGEFDEPDSASYRLTGDNGAVGAAVNRKKGGFGTVVGSPSDTAVLVGAPGAGSGLVTLLAAKTASLPLTVAQTWVETSATPRTGDSYGGSFSLANR